MKSHRGKGISGLEHSALAKYILSNNAMARDRELGGVGDCGGNQVVKAHREPIGPTRKYIRRRY